MHACEGVVYAMVGVLLVVAASLTLIAVGYELFNELEDGTFDAVTDALDGLLLVFILVELLGAVRVTVRERKLVAEPFLVVGIIASIRGIIIIGLEAREKQAQEFDDAMTEIAILGALVLALAIASWLVRRKEREPEEED